MKLLFLVTEGRWGIVFAVQVTDFGLSVVKGGVTPDNMMQDFCGTPIYMGQYECVQLAA